MSKKKKLLLAIGILLVISIGVGMSYAYYIATTSQQGENVIRSDCFSLEYVDDGQIVLDKAYPVRDSAVNDLTPYHFKIKNVCTLPASYQVNFEVLDTSTLDIQYLNYKLDDGSITSLSSATTETPTLNNATTAKLLATGNLLANEEVEYDLRVWIKETVTTSDPVQNKTLKSKVVVISTLNKAIIKNVILHPNGGVVDNELYHAYIGYKYGNLPTPTKDGDEVFIGWYTDSSFTNKVTNDSIVTSEVTDLYAKYGNPYEIVSGDLDTIGSIVKIDAEEFYVIGQEDSTHVKLLSKWNLNVGNNPQPGEQGIQNSKAIGWNSDSSTNVNDYYPATVAFSSTDYWYDGSALKPAYGSSYPAYVYDSNASIKQYVDTYVTYLNNQGVNVSGRLIKQEELVALGCNASTLYCDSNETHGGTAPSWVYQTTYWSGSARDGNYMWRVSLSGTFNYRDYDIDSRFGVRPVIILEK